MLSPSLLAWLARRLQTETLPKQLALGIPCCAFVLCLMIPFASLFPASQNLDTSKQGMRPLVGRRNPPTSSIVLMPISHLRTDEENNFLFDLRAASAVTWSPDGSRVAAYADAGLSIYVWDAVTGKRLGFGHRNAVIPPGPIGFLPDGKVIVAATRMNTASRPLVDLFSGSSGNFIGEVSGPFSTFSWRENIAQKFAVSAADGTLVTLFEVTSKNSFAVYKLQSNDTLKLDRLVTPTPSGTGALAFSPDGKLFALENEIGKATIFDTTSWRQKETIDVFPASEGLKAPVRSFIESLAFSPSGRYLAAGATSINLIRLLPPSLSQGVLDPDVGRRPMVSTEMRSPVRVYDLINRRFLPSITSASQPITQLDWISDQELLILGNEESLAVCRVDGSGACERNRGELVPAKVSSFSVSPDRRRIAVSANDQVTVFEISYVDGGVTR